MAKINNRISIITLHKKGKPASEIQKALKLPRSTIYATIQRYKQLGTTEDRPRSGRPTSVCTRKNVKIIREQIRRNPVRSMREMAKKLDVSDWAVRKIVKKHIKLRSYRFATGHNLDEPIKRENRLKMCRKLMRQGNFGTVLFSDEKLFTFRPPVNRRNMRVITSNARGKAKFFALSHKINFEASDWLFIANIHVQLRSGLEFARGARRRSFSSGPA